MAIPLVAAEQGEGRPLIILHGLFGSGRNWASVAARLASRHRVVLLDLRNHGASPWAETMSYAEMAEDVARVITQRSLVPATLIGHSMGGKAAMLVALQQADCVSRLVVVDVAPVAYPPVLMTYVRAMQGVDLGVARRADIDAQLAAAIPEAGIRMFLMQNLVAEEGRFRWRLNLDAIARALPDISGFPDLPPGLTYDGPTLFIAGARSDYVRPEHGDAIRRLFPNVEIVQVPNAGHWVHAEQPEAFLKALEPVLDAA